MCWQQKARAQRRRHYNERKRERERKKKGGPYLSAWARLETGNRKQKRAEANRHLRKEKTFVSNWRMTWKEKRSPQRWRLTSNCIVFKVQEFMYKNTAVLASAPQRKQEQKKGTNSGEESEQKQNTVRRER